MPKDLLTEPSSKLPNSHKAQGGPEITPVKETAVDRLLQLQRTLGNRRVTELIRTKRISNDGCIVGLRPKLTVGAADDPYEREADQIAQHVLSIPNSSIHGAESNQHISEDQEPSKAVRSIQLSAVPPGRESFEAGEGVESRLNASKGHGSPLPDHVRSYMEPRFGVDFSHVRVHTDNEAAELNRAVGAQAFAHGSEIYYGPGRAPANLELTAHELTHVVQQTGGKRREDVNRKCEACSSGGGLCPKCAKDQDQVASLLNIQSPPDRNVARSPVETADPPAAPVTSSPINGSAPANFSSPSAKPTSAPVVPSASNGNVPAAQPAGAPGPRTAIPGGPAPQTGGIFPSSNGAAKARTGEAARPQIDTSSSEGLLQSLASAPASSFPEALQSAKSSTPAVEAKQRVDLEKTYPEIDRPTGMAVSPGPRRTEPAVATAAAPVAIELAQDTKNAPLPQPTQVAEGPVPGSNVSINAAEPKSDDQDGGSWWDWLTGRLASLFGSIQTTDPGLSTSAGQRPTTDLGGQADPAQNETVEASGQEHLQAQQLQADKATTARFGEEDIAPKPKSGKLRPRPSQASTKGASAEGTKNYSAIPGDMRTQFDAAHGPSIRSGVGQQMARHRAQEAQFEAESRKAHEDGQSRMANENQEARAEQMEIKQNAKSEVDQERDRWRAENLKVVQTYSDGTHSKRAETEKQIADKVKSTDKTVDEKLTEAETKADEERKKAENDAAQKKTEAENKPRSFWEKVKGAVSSVFSELKNAITGIFEAMRGLVKKIIDGAKAIVHGLIEAAREAVIGLIKAFAAVVKAALSIALAAFPNLAKKARDWIDRRVNEAVDAVNRVADAAEKTIDAILDAIGEALDKALRALQAALLAILEALEAIARAALQVMEWLAKLGELLKKFGALLKSLEELIATGVEKVLNEAKKTLQTYIDQVPGKAEAFIQQPAKDLGKASEKHIQGIWRHLKPALLYLKSNWWGEIKQMVWNLVWPFNEKSPIWKDVPAMIKLPGKILDSLIHGRASEGIDEYLELSQKLNSVAGVFYGWFFIASVLIGAIFGGGVPGAIAGAGVAGEVGEGLLAAMVATETGVIAKAAYDLAFGPGTEKVNEGAYDRIANSGLTLAITGVMVMLGEIAADLAKAVIDGFKGLFKGEAAVEAPKAELPKGERPKPEAPKSETPAPEDIAAKEPTTDGEIEVTKDGRCVICRVCADPRVEYKTELDDPSNSKLKADLAAADALTDLAAKAKAEADVTTDLSSARSGKLGELQKQFGFSDEVLRILREKQIKPETVEKLIRKGVKPDDVGLYATVPHGPAILEGLLDKGIQPHIAERVLSLAESGGALENVNSLVGSGKLTNPPALRAILEAINSGDVGAWRELDLAARLAQQGHDVQLGGAADVVDLGKPGDPGAGKQAIQAKNVTSGDPRAVTDNLTKAADQLAGKLGEVPAPDAVRVADINIVNPKNPLFSADRATLSEMIRDALAGKTLADGRPAVQQVRIETPRGVEIFNEPGYLP